ncbi:MAG: HEAT repeat domain-containing protein [Planctomycetota bacterium]|nr:HEAT repeat domain-containing protein [Planctomycetota bacterium]
MRTAFWLALLYLFVHSTLPVDADTWVPYRDQRVVDPTGQYYVVCKPKGERSRKGIPFLFAERGPDNDAVEPAQEPISGRGRGDLAESDENLFGLREGDRLIARGTLVAHPYKILVSSAGIGFVAIERYGQLGFGESVVIVDKGGKIRHSLKLADLFTPEEISLFPHTASSIWWYEGGWIDEERTSVVLLGKGKITVVDFETGRVTPGGSREVLDAIASNDPALIQPALEATTMMRLGGLEDTLGNLLTDEEQPYSIRLRAAVALAVRGDRSGVDLVARTAQKPPPLPGGQEVWDYALLHLPDVLGEEALPILRDMMRTRPGTAQAPVASAFIRLGEAGVPTLIDLMGDGEEGLVRRAAASCLGQVGSKNALPALLDAAADDNVSLAAAALGAAIRIGGEEIAKDLLALLERGTSQDALLASHLQRMKYRKAIPALKAARRRHKKSSPQWRPIDSAIRYLESMN